MLVSLNLIRTRNDVQKERNALQSQVNRLERRGAILVHFVQDQKTNEDDNDESASSSSSDSDMERLRESEGLTSSELHTHLEQLSEWFVLDNDDKSHSPRANDDNDDHPPKDPCHRCENNIFFQYFLDGAAGVLYTSFIGLIIDQIIHYKSNKENYGAGG